MYSRVLAKEQEIRGEGFSLAAIGPGIVDTPMQAELRAADERSFSLKEEFIDFKESGKLASPEEAASKIWNAIEKINNKNTVVFSVKI
jgi:NAD(P)-dependent dehydrogenase (short-subunit alcohol dehydrogenase family)